MIKSRVKEYNKLVRDKIPGIIKAKGGVPKTRTLSSDAEYLTALGKKLHEEVAEYLDDPDIKELADILEIIHAILEMQNKSFAELESVRKEKAKERGGFVKRIFLETVEE